MRTYGYSVRAPQLRLQSSRKRPWGTWLIRIIHAHDAEQYANSRNEAAQKEETLPGREVRILFRGEHAEDIVVFVHGFAVVAPLLLVPPVAVGVAKLALLRDWIDVAAILRGWSVSPVGLRLGVDGGGGGRPCSGRQCRLAIHIGAVCGRVEGLGRGESASAAWPLRGGVEASCISCQSLCALVVDMT